MKTKTTTGKTVVGVTFIIGGVLVALNALVSGPHAFGGGTSAVAWLCLAGFILAGVGGKLIDDRKHNG